jgi:hypothetical protein
MTCVSNHFKEEQRSAEPHDVNAAVIHVSELLSPEKADNPTMKEQKKCASGKDKYRYDDESAKQLASTQLTQDVVNSVKKTPAKSEDRVRCLSLLVQTFSCRQLNEFVFNGSNVSKDAEGNDVVSYVVLSPNPKHTAS